MEISEKKVVDRWANRKGYRISQETEDEIFRLWNSGIHSCLEIGRRLGISDESVSKRITKMIGGDIKFYKSNSDRKYYNNF